MSKAQRLYKLLEVKTEYLQDYMSIFKKLVDIDVMNQIIFDSDQLNLYNNIPKPTLLISDSDVRLITLDKLPGSSTSIMNLKNSFKRIKNKSILTSVDKRLLQVLGIEA
jgi:hypothetical protein